VGLGSAVSEDRAAEVCWKVFGLAELADSVDLTAECEHSDTWAQWEALSCIFSSAAWMEV
jgi:hypothetical protein